MKAAGLRALEVKDDVQGVRVPAWLVYPAPGEPKPVRFGPYELEVVEGAALPREPLPLVVVSHGNGGSPWTHRGTALHLARAGFLVALVEHPGNSRADNSLAFTAANLANRPRHVRLVLDAVEALVRPSRVAILGQSIGGYTALAVAGGRPITAASEEQDGVSKPVPVTRDPRVSALVLLAPATAWFHPEGALADVDVPILLRTGEHDPYALSIHGEIVLRGVRDPSRVDANVVPNAGHFSFQTPFPPALSRPDFEPSQDPPGFDRAAYHDVLNAEIEAFLRGL